MEREPFGVAKPTKRRSPSSLNLKNPRNLKITGVISILLNPFPNKIPVGMPCSVHTHRAHHNIFPFFLFFFLICCKEEQNRQRPKTDTMQIWHPVEQRRWSSECQCSPWPQWWWRQQWRPFAELHRWQQGWKFRDIYPKYRASVWRWIFPPSVFKSSLYRGDNRLKGAKLPDKNTPALLLQIL